MSNDGAPRVPVPYVPSPASAVAQLLERLAVEIAEVRLLAERVRRDTTQLRDDVDALAAHDHMSRPDADGVRHPTDCRNCFRYALHYREEVMDALRAPRTEFDYQMSMDVELLGAVLEPAA